MQRFNMSEQRGVDGLHFVNALRKDLTSRLPEMAQMLEEAISDEVSKVVARCTIVDGSAWDGLHLRVNANWKQGSFKSRCGH